MIPGSNELKFQQTRLDSWKSIAQHLERSCRTVQRWHSQFGLPVRHLGGESGSVFAYADELDDWMANRGNPLRDEPVEVRKPQQFLPIAQQEPDSPGKDLAFSLISGQDEVRSAGLVALADRMWESLSSQSLRKITRLYRDATDLDPGNARALAGLAFALLSQGLWGLLQLPAAYAESKAALRLALEIDSELPLARCAEAWLNTVSNRDWQAARLGFDATLQSRYPRRAAIIGSAALQIAEASPAKASRLLLEATHLNPLASSAVEWLCWSEYLAGEYANALFLTGQCRAGGRHGTVEVAVEALVSIQFEEPDVQIERIEALVAQAPHIDVLSGALGFAYARAGKGRQASELIAAMSDTRSTQRAHEPYAIALPLIGLNQIQKAVGLLEESYRNGSIWSLGFRSDPILATLRNDPHFRHLMSRLSYPGPQGGDSHLGLVG